MSNSRAEDNKKRGIKGVTTGGKKPSAAQQARAAKKTTSSGRGAGKTPAVDSRAQRQKVSTAKVTKGGDGVGSGKAKVTASSGGSARTPGGPNKADTQKWQSYQKSAQTSGKGPVKGAPGTEGAPTNARPAQRTPGSQIAANKMKRTLRSGAVAKAANTAANVAKTVGAAKKAGLVGVAAAGLQSRNTVDGTLKGKPTGAAKGPKVPDRLTQGGTDKLKFDDAFRQARKSGAKNFTWRGKKYTTEVK